MDKQLKDEIMKTLEADGLEVAEETAYKIVKTAFKLVRALVPKVSATAGVVVIVVLDMWEDKIFAKIDEIDGVDSPDY